MFKYPRRFRISNSKFTVVLSPEDEVAQLVLSVPHDTLPNGEFSSVFGKRLYGTTLRDLHVWPIADEMLRISRTHDSPPVSAVRSLTPRIYLDANRPPKTKISGNEGVAYDDLDMAQIYREYHRKLKCLLTSAKEKYGVRRTILLDLHGFSTGIPGREYDLILGTDNRKSILYGNVDIEFGSFMTGLGYSVFVPDNESRPIPDPYSAGHITRFYSKSLGINALQIEIGRKFRNKDSKEIGDLLASDILLFFSQSKDYRLDPNKEYKYIR